MFIMQNCKELMSKPKSKANNSRKRVLNTNLENDSTDEPQSHSSMNRSLEIRKTQAMELLIGTITPKTIQFRDKEIEKINFFIDSCINKEKKGYKFLMLTGSPGAGKSLCANTVLNKKQSRIIKLNANITKSIQQVQLVLAEKLLEISEETKKISTALLIRQLQERKYKETCIVYIEQIQILFKNSPNELTEDFLDLFSKKGLNLILLGISNTIDALQKYSNKFSFNIQEIQNVVFEPYTTTNIIEIIKQKIQQIKVRTDIKVDYSDKLLKFSAQKVESLKKGDLRITLEFLKNVVRDTFKHAPTIQDQYYVYVITIEVINNILTQMVGLKHELMTALPYQQQVVLIAFFINLKKSDALALTYKELGVDLKWICQSLTLSFSKKFLEDGLENLEQFAIVTIKKKNNETRVMLNVALCDIEAAFHDHTVFKRFFNDEPIK